MNNQYHRNRSYMARAQNPPPHPSQVQGQGQGQGDLLKQYADEAASLRMELKRLQEQHDLLKEMGHFPSQILHAGTVEYPDRKPFPFLYRQELQTGAGEAFGETDQIVQAGIRIDNDNPVYLARVHFALIRTAHNTPSATIPLDTYLPLGGVNAAGIAGLDFIWRLSSDTDSRNWQTNWRDSSMLDFHNGYEIVLEHPLYRNELVVVEAQPYGVADAQENEAFRLFATLETYKMYEAYPNAL